jgi:hypothetical protein
VPPSFLLPCCQVQDPHRWNFEWACDWGSALGTF